MNEDAEFEMAKAIREKIFRIPLMPKEEVVEMFERLNAVLCPAVLKLVEESGLIRDYFVEIIFRIASGNTLGRNYFDKEDNEDKGEPKKKLLKPSEIRILKQSFSLPRLQKQNPKQFAKIVEEAGFIRGVYEEALELFLETTQEYETIKFNLELTKKANSIDYLKYETQYRELLNKVDLKNEEDLDSLVKESQDAWDGYVDLRSKIITPYFRLVYTWAKKSSSSEAQTLDNFQNGVFGLLRAVKNYTPSRFAAFSVVAEMWIKQSILLNLKMEANFIKLPVANWHLYQKLEKVRQRLEQQLNRDVTYGEISKESKVPEDKVQKIYDNAKLIKVFSLNSPTNNEDDNEAEGNWNLESIPAQDNLEESLSIKSEYEVVEKVVHHFDDEEKIIFGLISGCSELISPPNFEQQDLLKEKIRQKAAAIGLEINFKD